jgi:hypothetical protein
MPPLIALFELPVDVELWIVLAYVATLVVADRVVERLARLHFERARRHGAQGFEYIADEDHYRCAGGERLLLHLVDEPSRLAIYRAPAARCNGCPMKQGCTSHNDGRMVFRSLASWSESDVGWFHQHISAIMLGAGVVLCAVELLRRAEEPGADFLLTGFLICLVLLVQDLSKLRSFRSSK